MAEEVGRESGRKGSAELGPLNHGFHGIHGWPYHGAMESAAITIRAIVRRSRIEVHVGT
jgi:hypothetical protein